MAICKDLSTMYLHIFNSLALSFGLILLAISAYVLNELDNPENESFSELDLPNPVYATLVFACCLVVFAIIGIMGTCWENNCLLMIYILGILCLGLALVISGIVILTLKGNFTNVKDGQVENDVEERILDLEIAVFNECCASQSVLIFEPRSCKDDDPFRDQQVCVNDEERVEEFEEAIDDATCEQLEKLELDGVPLVGDVTEFDGRCGNGLAFIFVRNVNDYIEQNLNLLGAMNIVAGIILLLLLCAACAVLRSKEEEKRKAQQQQKKGCL